MGLPIVEQAKVRFDLGVFAGEEGTLAELIVVHTIGYQGRSRDGLLTALRSADIDILIDIRSKATSRKPGFSKKVLQLALEAHGIQYHHAPELGMPLDLLALRPQLSDNTSILEIYRTQMPTRHDAIDHLCQEAASRRICLLCFESDVSQCHRSVVADHLREERHLTIRHL